MPVSRLLPGASVLMVGYQPGLQIKLKDERGRIYAIVECAQKERDNGASLKRLAIHAHSAVRFSLER